jgi:uncharacterized membrane protein YbjE (DUF340 family)
MEASMAAEGENLIGRELRSPRAAALAGIAYSIMMYIIMLSTSDIRINPENITRENLQKWSGTASLVLILVPFCGITFLWFTGVIRDRLRHQEGHFFATLFFGSGLIIVVLLFIWGAILGAIMITKDMDVVRSVGIGIYVFAFVIMNEIVGNYSLRMAGVYMTIVGTLWHRTKLVPRWVTITTYILAFGFLVAADKIREARLIFPSWVFVVSIVILILNFRQRRGDYDEL